MKDKKMLYDKLNIRYKKKYGSDLGEAAIRGFTAVIVICDAVNRAGSATPDAIRKALELTDIPGKQLLMPWKGIRFDPRTHQNKLVSGVIVQLRENTRVTVWPPESAAGQIIWPMPRWKERDQESQ
jgi:branched-chain amino acid transport system substrate-binding protein